MWFIGGLGNPDKKYIFTRHNLGFDIIENLVNHNEMNLIKKDKDKEVYKGKIGNQECILCKPLTYMNLSGPPIGEIINFYKIPISKVIIIHDDLDISIGKIKIKNGGGNGGHNGLLSIDQTIGNDYRRIRIGIGHPGSKELVSKFVLEKFSSEDREVIDNIINLLCKNFELIFENNSLFLTKISSEG